MQIGTARHEDDTLYVEFEHTGANARQKRSL
jgi:hypothetical protein